MKSLQTLKLIAQGQIKMAEHMKTQMESDSSKSYFQAVGVTAKLFLEQVEVEIRLKEIEVNEELSHNA